MIGELTPEQKEEILTKASYLKEMVASGGWPVFKEIFIKEVENLRDFSVMQLERPSSELGDEVKLRLNTAKVLDLIFRDVIILIERGRTIEKSEVIKKKKNGIVRTRD